MSRPLWLLVLLVLLLSACDDAPRRVPAAQQKVDSMDVATIAAVADLFSSAYVRGDAAAMAEAYTDSAVIFPNGRDAIRGREAIRAYWTLPEGQVITQHRIMPERVEVHGDRASDYGYYEVSGTRDGEAWGPVRGKYVVVWHRGGDGRWRMHLDMWNRGVAER